MNSNNIITGEKPIPAGRDLDRRIAMEVLGLPPDLIHDGPGPKDCLFGGRICHTAENDHYSTNLAAVEPVIEFLRKRFRRVEIHIVPGPNGIGVILADGTDDVDEHYPFVADAETIEHAICLVALKAIGGAR